MSLGRREFLIFTLLVMLLTSSFMLYRVRTNVSLPFLPDQITSVEGTLTQEPAWSSKGNVNFILELTSAETADACRGECSGSIPVFFTGEDSMTGRGWMRGDAVKVSGRMSISNQDSRQRSFVFYARRLDRYSRTGTRPLREEVVKRVTLAAESLGGLSRILMPALVLGLRHPEQTVLNSLFRETGTAHIIALSGFHSGLVALLIFTLFKVPLGYKPALIAAAGGLLLYLYLAGIKPSLLRAVVMYILLVISRIMHRKVDIKKVLLASFLLTGLIMPESLHTLSARLSYLALWGILHTGPIFYSILKTHLGKYLSMGLSASLAAQIWTFPLVMGTFGQWYPSGIPSSLVLTPLVTLYMYSAIFLIFFQNFSLFSILPSLLCRLLVLLMSVSAGLLGKIPHLSVKEGSPGLFLILLFPLLLGAAYRPGGLSGKRKSESELRFHLRDKGSSGYDGAGAEKALGAELSDQQGSP